MDDFSYSEVRNPKWADEAQTTIECEVNFTAFEFEDFTPFAAVASGDYPHTHQIFAECVEGKWGPIAPFEMPNDLQLGAPEA